MLNKSRTYNSLELRTAHLAIYPLEYPFEQLICNSLLPPTVMSWLTHLRQFLQLPTLEQALKGQATRQRH